jgi:predicted dehydrogenase
MKDLARLIRYARIYGLRRSIVKAVSRLARALPLAFYLRRQARTIGLIGCGQFGFSTISYFLATELGNRFALCHDRDPARADLTRRCWGYRGVAAESREVIEDPATDLVYVASNHASHAPLAIAALRAGRSVYCEKPVAVTAGQLKELASAARAAGGRIFAGYNRPHSRAAEIARGLFGQVRGPTTISCTIVGHVLAADHWYRDPGEGTRICGNVGHWLDFAVNLLSVDQLADRWTLRLNPSSAAETDENVAIVLTSDRGDLVSIVLTARAEPYEGIYESILLQKGDATVRIDDFRSMRTWLGARTKAYRFRPKDVGHKRAVLQPFRLSAEQREKRWSEAVDSSLWMLELADMARSGELERPFSFAEMRRALDG